MVAWQLVCPRPSFVKTIPADFPYMVESIELTTTDGFRLRGWWVPAPGSDRGAVVLHGHAANRATVLNRVRLLRDAGYQVLAYDARACGESEGNVISFGYWETRDLVASLLWMRQQGVKDLAAIGLSQGASTILLAANELTSIGVKAVVIESPYATLREAVDTRFRLRTGLHSRPWLGLVMDQAESMVGVTMGEVMPIAEAGRLACPAFLVAGEQDVLATPDESRRIYEALPMKGGFWSVPWAGHTDFLSYDPAGYRTRVMGFLEQALPPH